MNRKVTNTLILAVLMIFIGSIAYLKDTKEIKVSGSIGTLNIKTSLSGDKLEMNLGNKLHIDDIILPGSTYDFDLKVELDNKEDTVTSKIRHVINLNCSNEALKEHIKVIINNEELDQDLTSNHYVLKKGESSNDNIRIKFSEDITKELAGVNFDLEITTEAMQDEFTDGLWSEVNKVNLGA